MAVTGSSLATTITEIRARQTRHRPMPYDAQRCSRESPSYGDGRVNLAKVASGSGQITALTALYDARSMADKHGAAPHLPWGHADAPLMRPSALPRVMGQRRVSW